jgi:hypothetical protein
MARLILTLILVGTLAVGTAQAKFTLNPDDNTLWIEDGAAPIEYGPGASDKYWQQDALQLLPLEGGGFMLHKAPGQGEAIGRYLPVAPEYPWFVMEIPDAYPTLGYRGLNLHFDGGLGMELGGLIKRGLYEYRPLSKTPERKGTSYWRLYLYGWDVTVKSMKMVKRPDYRLDVTTVDSDTPAAFQLGDTVVFRFSMPEPAEDVTLRVLNDDYWMGTVSLNSEPLVQLYPTDGEMRVWQATIQLKSGDPARKFDPGALLFRFQVLGGPLTYPVFIGNSAAFDLTARPARQP